MPQESQKAPGPGWRQHLSGSVSGPQEIMDLGAPTFATELKWASTLPHSKARHNCCKGAFYTKDICGVFPRRFIYKASVTNDPFPSAWKVNNRWMTIWGRRKEGRKDPIVMQMISTFNGRWFKESLDLSKLGKICSHVHSNTPHCHISYCRWLKYFILLNVLQLPHFSSLEREHRLMLQWTKKYFQTDPVPVHLQQTTISKSWASLRKFMLQNSPEKASSSPQARLILLALTVTPVTAHRYLPRLGDVGRGVKHYFRCYFYSNIIHSTWCHCNLKETYLTLEETMLFLPNISANI